MENRSRARRRASKTLKKKSQKVKKSKKVEKTVQSGSEGECKTFSSRSFFSRTAGNWSKKFQNKSRRSRRSKTLKKSQKVKKWKKVEKTSQSYSGGEGKTFRSRSIFSWTRGNWSK